MPQAAFSLCHSGFRVLGFTCRVIPALWFRVPTFYLTGPNHIELDPPGRVEDLVSGLVSCGLSQLKGLGGASRAVSSSGDLQIEESGTCKDDYSDVQGFGQAVTLNA